MAALPAALPQGRIVQASRADVQITGEDIKHAVQAYKAAGDHKARASVWAADLRPRFRAEFERAIQAANSLGDLSGDLILQQSLDNILYQFPLLSRISTNFSGEGALLSQTITTRLRAQRTATDFVTADGYVAGDATHTDVDIVIDKHKYDMVTFSVTDLAKTRRDLFGEEEEGMLYSVVKAMIDDLYALITTANFTNTPTTKSLLDFGRDTIVDMKVALHNAKVFGGVRTLLLNSNYYGAAEKDVVIINNQSNPSAAQVFGASKLPTIAEFAPFEAGNLPTTGNLTGFGFRADALAMASRLPSDYTTAIPGLPSTGVVSTIMHPESGLSLQKVAYLNHQMGNASARVALMYGVAKGRAVAGQILRSAA